MRRFLHALTVLYAIAGFALIYFALTGEEQHSTGYGLVLVGSAVLFAVAIFHHGYHRDELRAARAQLERFVRPPGPPRPETDAVIAVALAAACCEVWWASAGAEHDPEHCTRKDQTT